MIPVSVRLQKLLGHVDCFFKMWNLPGHADPLEMLREILLATESRGEND